MDDIYQLNLEKEVVAEFANNVVNRLMIYMIKAGISFDNTTNPLVVLFSDLWELTKSEIPQQTSIEEVKDSEAYLKRTYHYVKKLEVKGFVG